MKTSTITLTILLAFSAVFAADRTATGYKKIVSLAPSITKSIYLLGAQDRLIAVTIYCPPEAASKEKIGTVYEPNIEKIVTLSPDLVLAAKEGNLQQSVESLRKLGIAVYVVDEADNFTDICANFLALAKVIGEETKARALIENNRRKISEVRNSVKNIKKPTVFWQIGCQPIFTASRRSFVNEFIELAGGANIFGDLGPRYPNVSREEVVRRDPDVIIMVSMGDVTMDEKAKWQGFKSLKAVKNGSIYMLDDPLFTNPTPQSIADGVEIVAKLLKNGAKK